jgi:hypothetical protein
VVLKASVRNLLKLSEWEFDHIDETKHPEWVDPNFWASADFTLFVWCPWNVTLGGPSGVSGKITFPDFYDGEHSDDGTLWTFYSREGTKLYKAKDPSKSSYFKGYADRSSDSAFHGPITIDTSFQTSVDYTCETGVLPGHQKNMLAKYAENFPIFADGDFRKMVFYIRATHKDLNDFSGYDLRRK